jgi:hypothetical protein
MADFVSIESINIPVDMYFFLIVAARQFLFRRVSPDSLIPIEEITEYHAFLLVSEENGAQHVISKAELHEQSGRKFWKPLAVREERKERQATTWTPPAWAVPQPTLTTNENA